MAEKKRLSIKAYCNESFLKSRNARALRILSEYLEPESRLGHYHVNDTIVFMGSARIVSSEQAQAALAAANKRVSNILIKQDREAGFVDADLLEADAEKDLATTLNELTTIYSQPVIGCNRGIIHNKIVGNIPTAFISVTTR